jgi:hypothetical protein
MSDVNPYSSTPMEPNLGAPSSYALNKAKTPAIALLVVGVINVLLGLWGLANNAISMANPQAMEQQLQAQFDAQGGAPEGFDPQMIMRFAQAGGAIGIVLSIVQIAVAALIIAGAAKMMKLQSYGLAMTASILAMVPCLSACCLIGLPIGIWSLIVLNDPAVKSAFR